VPASVTSVTRGTLFIVGGGPQPPALVQEFVRLAGGPGRAKIIVFAMASSDGATSGEEKARDLRTLGATALNVFVNHDQANTDSVAHLLDGATGIWSAAAIRCCSRRHCAGRRPSVPCTSATRPAPSSAAPRRRGGDVGRDDHRRRATPRRATVLIRPRAT